MIRAGWAMVYDQMNAEYGKEGKEQYLAAQAAAKCVVPFLFPPVPPLPPLDYPLLTQIRQGCKAWHVGTRDRWGDPCRV